MFDRRGGAANGDVEFRIVISRIAVAVEVEIVIPGRDVVERGGHVPAVPRIAERVIHPITRCVAPGSRRVLDGHVDTGTVAVGPSQVVNGNVCRASPGGGISVPVIVGCLADCRRSDFVRIRPTHVYIEQRIIDDHVIQNHSRTVASEMPGRAEASRRFRSDPIPRAIASTTQTTSPVCRVCIIPVSGGSESSDFLTSAYGVSSTRNVLPSIFCHILIVGTWDLLSPMKKARPFTILRVPKIELMVCQAIRPVFAPSRLFIRPQIHRIRESGAGRADFRIRSKPPGRSDLDQIPGEARAISCE